NGLLEVASQVLELIRETSARQAKPAVPVVGVDDVCGAVDAGIIIQVVVRLASRPGPHRGQPPQHVHVMRAERDSGLIAGGSIDERVLEECVAIEEYELGAALRTCSRAAYVVPPALLARFRQIGRRRLARGIE